MNKEKKKKRKRRKKKVALRKELWKQTIWSGISERARKRREAQWIYWLLILIVDSLDRNSKMGKFIKMSFDFDCRVDGFHTWNLCWFFCSLSRARSHLCFIGTHQCDTIGYISLNYCDMLDSECGALVCERVKFLNGSNFLFHH